MPADAPAAASEIGNLDFIQNRINTEVLKIDPPAPPSAAPKPEPAKPAAPAAKSPSSDPGALPDPDFTEPDAVKPADVEQADDTPSSLSEKGKADWKKLRDDRREFEQKWKEAEAKLAQGANPEEVQKKIEQYETSNKELRTQLQAVALERDPQFVAYFDGQRTQMLERAKQIGGEKIAGILSMPAGQHRDALLNQALAEMEGPLAQNQIATLALQIDSLQSQKSAELSKAGERWNQMTAQQQHAKAEEAKRLNATLDSTLDRWSKGVEMLRPKDAGTDGAAEHNARAERIKAQARNLYNGKVPETEAAKASIWAAMGPEFVSELKAANKKIAEQAKQIADLKAAGPSLDGGDGADANGNENESFGAAVDRRLRAAGLHR